MRAVIIDYGSGNLRSAAKAFERSAATVASGFEVVVTDDADLLAAASHIVLPGVGAFADCMAGLEAVPGMRDALDDAVLVRGRPFLGICVGMQLMATRGLEYGVHTGLDWIAGEVIRFDFPPESDLKVPHMGWNDLSIVADSHPVLAGIETGQHAYFVHSYHLACADPGDLLATVDYGGPVSAIVGRDNMIGTQFHPEKSQALGLHLIENFLRWRP